jgi:hypothetical protein
VVEFASAILAHVVDSGRSLGKFGGKSHKPIRKLWESAEAMES